MNWLETILVTLAIGGAATCFIVFAWLKLKPVEYENCALKPRGFLRKQKPVGNKDGNRRLVREK